MIVVIILQFPFEYCKSLNVDESLKIKIDSYSGPHSPVGQLVSIKIIAPIDYILYCQNLTIILCN